MFGTMGFSELIIILVIMFVIFGAGRLPQIGEGVGKALKGFRKEVNEPPQSASDPPHEIINQQPAQTSRVYTASSVPAAAGSSSPMAKSNSSYVPGPELTPGTTASFLYHAAPQAPQPSLDPSGEPSPSSSQVLSMEERVANPVPTALASYPSVPAGAQLKPATKRPSAIVNKEAVVRVQAQQAAIKAKASPAAREVSSDDLQNLGEGLGEVVRTFRQAVTDVRNSVDPQMRTIQTEVDAAQKEIQQSIEAAKELPPAQDESTKSS